MLYPALEEKLRQARLSLDGATSESIIDLCRQYLALLAEYRSELYTLPDTLDLRPRAETLADTGATDIRKEVRAAIERTTRERVWAEALILSFTAISGYGAVETFNRQQYRGRDDWQLQSGGVSFRDDAGVQKVTIQEAVETASLLRREEYVAKNAAAARGKLAPDSPKVFQPAIRPMERS